MDRLTDTQRGDTDAREQETVMQSTDLRDARVACVGRDVMTAGCRS